MQRCMPCWSSCIFSNEAVKVQDSSWSQGLFMTPTGLASGQEASAVQISSAPAQRMLPEMILGYGSSSLLLRLMSGQEQNKPEILGKIVG